MQEFRYFALPSRNAIGGGSKTQIKDPRQLASGQRVPTLQYPASSQKKVLKTSFVIRQLKGACALCLAPSGCVRADRRLFSHRRVGCGQIIQVPDNGDNTEIASVKWAINCNGLIARLMLRKNVSNYVTSLLLKHPCSAVAL